MKKAKPAVKKKPASAVVKNIKPAATEKTKPEEKNPPQPEAPVTTKNTITIRKGKIKDDMFLDVDYEQVINGEQQDSFSRECNHAIHPDLRSAFAKLKIHYILLCHQIPDKDAIRITDTVNAKIPMMDDVIVRQFSLSGTGQKEGLILSGSRKLKDGTILHLNSPFRRLCDDNSSYKHLDDLNEVLGLCSKEIEKYLFEEKYGEAKQTSIEFGENEDMDPGDDDND